MSDSIPDGWRSVKLGDVAEERSDRVDNPSQSGYDRFVGLEHLDSGELTVRRWGSTADLRSAMKFFKSGDLLIGRRNAYLKRASKAEFDGICSGDAYVVREKPGKIAEDLLPIILNSDSFWDYTIAHASGTMSKRAKWRDLADYSFLLPPPEEQRRIATMLWAAEDCIVMGERFVVLAERAKQVLMYELFSKGIGHTEFQDLKGFGKIPKSWEMKKIGDLAISATSGSTPLGGEKVYQKTGIPLLREQNVQMNKLDLEDVAFISKEIHDSMKRSTIQPEDVLLNITGASIGRVAVTPNSLKEANVNQHVCRIRLNNGIIPSYVSQYLSSIMGQKQIMSMQIGSSRQGLNFEQVKSLQVPFPSLPEQRQIATILTRCDDTIAAARTNVMAAKALKMKMINEMLGAKTN